MKVIISISVDFVECGGDYDEVQENMNSLGEEQIFTKLSLEDCKTKCDNDHYCNYFSHNISTSICKTMHEMKNSSDHKLMDDEDDDFLLCKKSKKFITFMI